MSDTTRRPSARRGATRAAVLAAALESFIDKGYEGASLRDIAQRAGITHAGLLHHFRGKDELLLAILADQDEAAEAQDAPELTDPWTGPEAVLRFLRRAIADRNRSPELLQLRNEIWALAGRPDHVAHDYVLGRQERIRRLLAANFRERMRTGTLRPHVDPERAAALWLAVEHGLTMQWLVRRDFPLLGTLGQFLQLILTPPGTGRDETATPAADETDDVADSTARGPTVEAPASTVRRPTPSSAETRRATMHDVAREAGVSVSAVSKVLRDAYGVSPQMRARVTAAIETLGYRPHAAARAMRGHSYTVGVMLPELSSPFPGEVSESISRELERTSYQGVLVAAGLDTARQQQSIEALLDRQVDGLILIAPWTNAQWLEDLGARVPTVVVALHGGGDNFDTVVDDDYEGSRLIVDHLVGLGHRRILHTGQPSRGLVPPHVLSHTARCDAYVEAMAAHGLEADVLITAYSEEGGYQAATEALDRPQPPTAIFAGADIAALGALRAAEDRGLHVPEDLTVVGYDNIYTSTIRRVALTTVDQSGTLTGTTAARLLLERLAGRTEPVHHLIQPRLIVRATSAQPSRR
jgi:LacI family transcriptional regulator